MKKRCKDDPTTITATPNTHIPNLHLLISTNSNYTHNQHTVKNSTESL